MRGYDRLNSQNRLRRITMLKEALTVTTLPCVTGRASPRIFGKGIEDAELIARQVVLTRFVGKPLTEALLRSVGTSRAVTCSMPREWYGVLRERGFEVAELSSAVAWRQAVLLQFARGIRDVLRIVRLSAQTESGRGQRTGGRIVHFQSLASGNLPQPGLDGRSHDIMSWYHQWVGRRPEVDAFTHDVATAPPLSVGGIRVLAQPAIPPLRGSALGKFVLWAIAAAAQAGFDMLRGRWWHALLLGDAALAAARRIQPESLAGCDYLFHNSDWISRPLWTYDAQAAGARIILYFYSTNTEGFSTEVEAPMTYGWAATNWPLHLVWDEYQANFVRRAVGADAPVSVAGPIWFHTSAETAPPVAGKSIAVFDVIPFRDSYYQMLGIDVEYYVADTSIDFLSDIQRTADDASCVMLWKRKRHIGSVTHRRYRRAAAQLSERANVMVINPDVSAVRLIEAADLVVSMPYTSTALIADHLRKPSCYYDPTGRLNKGS